MNSGNIACTYCQLRAIKGKIFSRFFFVAKKNEKDYYSRFRMQHENSIRDFQSLHARFFIPTDFMNVDE